ncbi:MAG: hypothetical protein GX542_01655 [Rhodococcus sp.]|nr:hypothetical protein [Rhodococcus sp. (in: high G+C Gram-positive bacteria)]
MNRINSLTTRWSRQIESIAVFLMVASVCGLLYLGTLGVLYVGALLTGVI